MRQPYAGLKVQAGNEDDELNATQIAQARPRLASMGRKLLDDDIRKIAVERARCFVEDAPTKAAQAATIIVDGVKADPWRILVGADAHKTDERVRANPEQAYEVELFESFA